MQAGALVLGKCGEGHCLLLLSFFPLLWVICYHRNEWWFLKSKCISEAIYSRDKHMKCIHWLLSAKKRSDHLIKSLYSNSFKTASILFHPVKPFSNIHLFEAQLTFGIWCLLWCFRARSWTLSCLFSILSLGRYPLHLRFLTQMVLWGFFVKSIKDSFVNGIAWLWVSLIYYIFLLSLS